MSNLPQEQLQEQDAHPRVDEKTIATGGIDLLGEEAKPIDPEVERRVLRKIDLFLMPAMVIGMQLLTLRRQCTDVAGYGLVYYDKVGRSTLQQFLSDSSGNSRKCSPLWHDYGLAVVGYRQFSQPASH